MAPNDIAQVFARAMYAWEPSICSCKGDNRIVEIRIGVRGHSLQQPVQLHTITAPEDHDAIVSSRTSATPPALRRRHRPCGSFVPTPPHFRKNIADKKIGGTWERNMWEKNMPGEPYFHVYSCRFSGRTTEYWG